MAGIDWEISSDCLLVGCIWRAIRGRPMWNENQKTKGRIIPFAEKCVGVQVQLWNQLTTCAIPRRFWGWFRSKRSNNVSARLHLLLPSRCRQRRVSPIVSTSVVPCGWRADVVATTTVSPAIGLTDRPRNSLVDDALRNICHDNPVVVSLTAGQSTCYRSEFRAALQPQLNKIAPQHCPAWRDGPQNERHPTTNWTAAAWTMTHPPALFTIGIMRRAI